MRERLRLLDRENVGNGSARNNREPLALNDTIPMLRAVPSMIRPAWSTSRAFRSCSFFLAISSTCFFVSVKPLYLPPFLASAGITSFPCFFPAGSWRRA